MSGEMRLDLFRVGHCLSPAALTAQGASWRIAEFPAGVALLHHPQQGAILFDSGYGESFFRATHRLPERIYRWLTPVRLAEQQRLTRQLRKRGVTRPDLVILSHLHGDHAAGLFDLESRDLPVITSVAAQAGLDAGRFASLKAGCPRLLRDQLRAQQMGLIEAHPQISLPADELGAFRYGHDLFANGQMITIPLPGHGQGQFGLYLPKLASGPAFLIADAAWSLQALRQNSPPPRAMLNRLGDAARYLETFAALRQLQQIRPDLRLIPSHCPETFPAEPFATEA